MTDENLFSLKPYLFRYWKNLLAGFFFYHPHQLFVVAGPRYIRIAIDTMTGPFVMEDVAKNAELYVLFALVSGFFLFLVRQNIIVASRHIEYDLKKRLLSPPRKASKTVLQHNQHRRTHISRNQ